MKTPVLLKEDALNQFDQSFSHIGIDTRLGLSLSQKITDGHVATNLVFKGLKECDGVEYQWIDTDTIFNLDLNHDVQVIFCQKMLIRFY